MYEYSAIDIGNDHCFTLIFVKVIAIKMFY